MTEFPQVARRWRAITRAKVRLQKTQDWRTETFASNITAMLVTFKRARKDDSFQQKITNQFQDKFQVILDLADKIESVMYEGIISQDYRLSYVAPGKPFNEETMVNTNESSKRKRKKARLDLEQSKAPTKPVLCTVSLGLFHYNGEFVNDRLVHKGVVRILPTQVSLMDVLD
jgi:PDZ domain-containing secreted protein